MRRSVLTSVVVAAFLLTGGPAAASESAKRQDVRRLLELTGSSNMGAQVIEQLIANFQTMLPQVPRKFWDDFKKEAKPDVLIELIVPIYDKHLTHAEIKAVIAFHNTAAGKKFFAVLPLITKESMEIGEKWGLDLAMKIQRQLQFEGYQ